MNKIPLFSIILLLIFKNTSFSQQFEKAYGYKTYTYGYAIDKTVDNGFIIAGETTNKIFYYSYAQLSKIDSIGNLIWTRSFGNQFSYNSPKVVRQTLDNGFIISGYHSVAGEHMIMIIKVDSTGTLQWFRNFESLKYQEGNDIIQSKDSGFLITGYLEENDHRYGSLIKLNLNGSISWAKSYKVDTANFELSSVIEDVDHGFVAVGACYSLGNNFHRGFLLKIDDIGNIKWTKCYYNPERSILNKIVLNPLGGFTVSGINYLPQYIWVARLKSDGELLWSKSYINPNNQIKNCNSMVLDQDGYSLCGELYNQNYFKALILKIDTIGNTKWAVMYDSADISSFKSIVKSVKGGYTLIGGIRGKNNLIKALVVCTDKKGRTNCNDSPINFSDSVLNTTDTMKIKLYADSLNLIDTSKIDIIVDSFPEISLCSVPTVINKNPDSNNNIHVYPNPVINGEFNLEFTFYPGLVELFNTSGQKVYQQPLLDNSTIIKVNLPSGLYLLKVNNLQFDYFKKLIID